MKQKFKLMKLGLCSSLLTLGMTTVQAQTTVDVWDSTDSENYILVGQIETIQSQETGKAHYNYYTASGHPACVNSDRRHANLWMHENSLNGDLTFGFLFAKHVTTNDLFNSAEIDFRIVDSSTDPYVSQSDDPGEAVETPAGSDAFIGDFYYNRVYTDGIAVSGVGGQDWTVIINGGVFGNITQWFAASGGSSSGASPVYNADTCTDNNLDDITLTIGHEYRLTPAGHTPSGAPVLALDVSALAGPDQQVSEGQVTFLDGSTSQPALGAYSWVQIPNATVSLSDSNSATPNFTAPSVDLAGTTLTFELTYTAIDQLGAEVTDRDTIDISVVNINTPPVAEAGEDLSVTEGAPVSLSGLDSYDPDGNFLTYEWSQTGLPAVMLTNANTATPSFDAPYVETGSGIPGVVAVLEFTLRVRDGDFSESMDSVLVEITNVNNDPVANAGSDQTLSENSFVQLDGNASSDPDSDSLTYAWSQTDGPLVTLTDAVTATPSLMAPFVNAGGSDLTFELTVDDGFGGVANDTVVIHLQNANDPPLVTAAQPTKGCLWPPNHKLVSVGITGVSDPDDNATITIDSVTQDEATNGLGDGDTAIDAVINNDGTVLLRAERSGTEDGRVYHVNFTASDLEGSASGTVDVCVQHNKKRDAVDGGAIYDSTQQRQKGD